MGKRDSHGLSAKDVVELKQIERELSMYMELLESLPVGGYDETKSCIDSNISVLLDYLKEILVVKPTPPRPRERVLFGVLFLI